MAALHRYSRTARSSRSRVDPLASGRVERTWRPPVSYRIAVCAGLAVLVTLPATVLWATLCSRDALGWLILVVPGPVWAWLASRGWTVSATLTADALRIRKVFGTRRIALADITGLSWSGSLRGLKVAERRVPSSAAAPAAVSGRHHAPPAKRHWVPAIQRGVFADAAGLRSPADEAADVIASAAGLPPMAPHKGAVTKEQARFAIPFSVGLFAAGGWLLTTRNVVTHFTGRMLLLMGAALFFPAFLATLGRLRGRT
jgi:hypothetical protein